MTATPGASNLAAADEELPSGFHNLKVAASRSLCDDAAEIEFELPAHAHDRFQFRPGQHIAVRRVVDGEELRRNYSITCLPGEGRLAVGVRRIDDGRVSTWLTRELAPGDQIAVMEPTGRFTLPEGAAESTGAWLFVAAGSGITPILSILRGLLATAPRARAVLLYGNRSVDTIMFRQELDALKSQHLDRLAVLHFLSRERRRAGMLDGRIDEAVLSRLAALGVPAAHIEHAFLCGPEPLVAMARAALGAAGMAEARIHSELFDTGHGPVQRPRPEPDAEVTCQATIRMHGVERVVGVLAGETVLDAARRSGMDAPYSCTNGVCATCRAHIDEGSATMATNYALAADEVADGYTLTCQATPDTDQIVVDYDRQ